MDNSNKAQVRARMTDNLRRIIRTERGYGRARAEGTVAEAFELDAMVRAAGGWAYVKRIAREIDIV
jgi:hypothetical protein